MGGAEFTKVIPASCLNGSGLVLPSEFRDTVVKADGRQEFKLQNSAGKQWSCTVKKKQQGAHERADITSGWKPFATENGLKAGDEILVRHLGGNVIQITATGRTGSPKKNPKAGKTPSRKTPAAKTPAAKTPTSGAVAKRRGSSTGKKKQQGAAAAAAAGLAPSSARGRRSLQHAVAAAVAPEAAPAQNNGGSWCTIM